MRLIMGLFLVVMSSPALAAHGGGAISLAVVPEKGEIVTPVALVAQLEVKNTPFFRYK